ncbi:M23 family metallopeptidase [Novosphingobium sp. YJ-S2-02]|uniref:M23 family metallopeptidase n=1 Tax=Novosphingobium aureum TaxID=2792964 RepID=A0A931H9K8_9SPHN|nr:M23 family metallopeptidase [Novosphingobium aureum]MBH0111479.1 M23 family metallopeptidase [Novosphingobium aureum]
MFKAHEQNDGAGPDGARCHAARLSHAHILEENAADAARVPGGTKRREGGLRAQVTAFEAWCARVEIAPDLACDIGSRKWFRGLATMLGLSAAAIALWPDFSAVEAATMVPVEGRMREEFRSQTISPLAFGADVGRHMGASPLVTPLDAVPDRPRIELVSTLAQGDSFQRMLERAGLGAQDIAQVTGLVGQAMPLSEIASGTRFDITLGKRPSPDAPRSLEAIDFRARFDLDLSVARPGVDDPAQPVAGPLALHRHPIAVDATPLRIRGKVGAGLYRSARAAGAPVAAIQAYLKAVDRHLSLDSDIQSGDEFDMIVAYKRSARGERQVGELLYAGVEREGKPRLQLLRWGKDGEMFAAGSLGEARKVPIGQPVAGRVTSNYGMRRHPILGYKRMHAGIDYGASYGTPIHAVADGRVTYAGRHGGHGNYVRLEHSGGLGTGYGHMSRIAVRSGTRVKAGQVIGYVGSTGLSTGPHLHLEAYRNGHTINPAGLKILQRPRIEGKERDAFMARLHALETVAPGAALADMAPDKSEAADTGREIDRLEPEAVG